MKKRIPLYIHLAMDPAVTDKSYSNATGFTLTGESEDGTWYTLLADAYRGLPDAVIDHACFICLQYRPDVLSCEIIAAQRLFIPMLREAFTKYAIKTSIQPYKYSTRLSKHARIASLQPKLKQGKWFFAKGKCDELIAQMLRYPETGDEDDLIDAAAQHVAFLHPYNPHYKIEQEDEGDYDPDMEEEDVTFKRNGAYIGLNQTRYRL